MIGRNSAVGAAAPLDGSIALIQAIVQVESAGMTADTAVLKKLAKESETLRIALVRNDQVASARTRKLPRAMHFMNSKSGSADGCCRHGTC